VSGASVPGCYGAGVSKVARSGLARWYENAAVCRHFPRKWVACHRQSASCARRYPFGI